MIQSHGAYGITPTSFIPVPLFALRVAEVILFPVKIIWTQDL
jgi:hypothetical protein